MNIRNARWWASASLMIVESRLDPVRVAMELASEPTVSFQPGESKIHHLDSVSAGYWSIERRFNDPDKPDVAFRWLEQFVESRESVIDSYLSSGYLVSAYFTVHSRLLTIGFELPCLSTITRLRIPISCEFYSALPD